MAFAIALWSKAFDQPTTDPARTESTDDYELSAEARKAVNAKARERGWIE
jgi:hypothetical protein